MAYQARCHFCFRRYVWKSSYPLKDARCPICGHALHRTTLNNRLPVYREAPAYNLSSQVISEVT